MLSAPKEMPSESSPDKLRSYFHYLAASTLAHVLALFLRPPASFPQSSASLVVIDSLSTLIDNAYPRNTDDRVKNKTDQSKWAAGRRYAVINDLIATFTKFAALHDIALVVTCQTITRIRGTSRALLVPAITGIEWENGISTRLLLFRDWVPQQAKAQDKVEADRLQKTRFAGLVKVHGVALVDEGGVGNVVPFAIESVSSSGTIQPARAFVHEGCHEHHVLLTRISMVFATSTSLLTTWQQPWCFLSKQDRPRGRLMRSTRTRLKNRTRTKSMVGSKTTVSPPRDFSLMMHLPLTTLMHHKRPLRKDAALR